MGRGRFGTDSPASPHPSGAGSAGQRPWRNTDFHSNEAFWHRLARLPSTFWGRLSRAETLEEHGLPQQRGFWRRLARLPSPFWGRLSRADPLEVPRPQKKRQSVDQWETKRLSVDRFGGSRHPGRTGTRKNDKVLPG
ncbi:hypothetical protein ROHU_037149 [Labeo rohita]|uniref:Uncharacterized protein n=1 Tax=Labeo rohita TaxID=84645 RepID=A0A498M3I0_LABRO|nr:hypothetical protein ROHU_037149 [Labeo rohita]